MEQGLPSSEVHDIYQDANGFMWFATDLGIVRYNGEDFKVFDKENGLKSNVIFNFFEMAPNKLWFSDINNNLYCFNPLEFPIKIYPYRFNNQLTEAFSSLVWKEYIRRIWIDDQMRLNISFLTGTGRFIIDNKGNVILKNRIENKRNDNSNSKNKGIYNRNILIHFIKKDGITSIFSEYIQGESSGKIIVNINNKKVPTNIIARDFSVVHQFGVSDVSIKERISFFIVGKYLFKVENEKLDYTTLNSEALKLCVHDKKLYVTTYNGCEVYDLDLNRQEIILKNKRVTGIFFDNEGGFWLSTAESGVYYLSDPSIKCVENLAGINMVFEYMEVNHKYVVGTSWDKHFWAIDKQTGIQHTFPRTVGYSGYYSSSGHTDLSPYLQPGKESKKSMMMTSPVSTIYLSNNKRKGQHDIFTFKTRVTYFKEGKRSIHKYIRDNIKMTSSILSERGEILIATVKGLYHLVDSNQIEPIFHNHSILRKPILYLSNFREGILGVTKNDGAFYFDYNKSYVLNKKNGLIANKITDLVVKNENEIWISSYKGVDKVNIGNKISDVQLDHLNASNGLLSSEVTSVDIYNDTLWVATKRGLNMVLPKEHYRKSTLLTENFSIDSIKLNNNIVKKGTKQIVFSEYDRLEVYFTQCSYSQKIKVEYAYYISGLTEKWEEINSNKLVLSNLPLGERSVYIRSYIEGLEKGTPIELRIEVTSVYWKSTIAIVLYIAVLIVLLAFVYRLAQKRTSKKQEEELEKVKLELKALISQMNPHFTFNTINSIQHYVLEKDRKEALKYLSDFASIMRQSLDFSRKELVSLNEELEFLKLYVELENRRFKNKIKFNVSLDLISNKDAILFPALLLHPIIENSIIHGIQPLKGSGNIKLHFKEYPQYFEIILQDNGVGFSKKDKPSYRSKRISHGFNILKRRVKLYNGKEFKASDIIVKSLDDHIQGTLIIVRLNKEEMMRKHFKQ